MVHLAPRLFVAIPSTHVLVLKPDLAPITTCVVLQVIPSFVPVRTEEPFAAPRVRMGKQMCVARIPTVVRFKTAVVPKRHRCFVGRQVICIAVLMEMVAPRRYVVMRQNRALQMDCVGPCPRKG